VVAVRAPANVLAATTETADHRLAPPLIFFWFRYAAPRWTPMQTTAAALPALLTLGDLL
jgi:hypothetical protein